jgi:DNA (cytosine-5)-methyltransferase 1
LAGEKSVKNITEQPSVPVVDLFAGPGGLSEGFSSFEFGGSAPFDVRLSVEKDPKACATLTLRKYFRQFAEPPDAFAAYFEGRLSRKELFAAFPVEAARAERSVWEAELGLEPRASVSRRVRKAIGDRRDWVLLGGPPCQAYSIAGRARMRGTRPDFEDDARHFLYREYLRIVADHEPAVFVLENVKGLLTSTHGGSPMVGRIIDDLSAPGAAVPESHKPELRYHLYPLSRQQAPLPWMEDIPSDGEEFLLQAEQYGVPQNRHRLFIVGVRSDVPGRPSLLRHRPRVTASSVLSDLPPIRSALTRELDSPAGWRNAIAAIGRQDWISASSNTELGQVAREIRKVLKALTSAHLEIGASSMNYSAKPVALGEWYRRNAVGITHHESRAHMRDDLQRYLFCACFGRVFGKSPKIRDFPKELYPSHRNISRAVDGNMFDDRFRVQIADQPSTTITSHVSKDGHYYIHYDPMQCRSLTVREAARLQTFPDSYFFEGGRTDQYHQIGNAVPPLLARDIASVVFELLCAARKPLKLRAAG